MRLLAWLLRGFVFFTLFAFALNNQHGAVVHWFFGMQWRAPMVIVVLAAFALGCAVGVLGMVPSWWRRRRAGPATASPAGTPAADAAIRTEPAAASAAPLDGPPRALL